MMQKYVIGDCYKKFILRLMENSWQNWKSSISRSIRKVVDAGMDVSQRITILKPDESTDRKWDDIVKIRTSEKFKEISQTKQAPRAKQMIPYTLSRKCYARYEHDWKIENTGKSISRVDLWIEGHKKGRETRRENRSTMLQRRQFFLESLVMKECYHLPQAERSIDEFELGSSLTLERVGN